MISNTVLTGDVRQTLDHFRRSVDQLFENFYGFPTDAGRPAQMGQGSQQWMFTPAVESAWGEQSLNLRAILPGVSQNDLKVSVQHNQLVLEGERRIPEGFQKNAYTQLPYGKFFTTVTLPSGLDIDKLNARMHDGVLDIQIPASEQSKRRQVQIQSGEQSTLQRKSAGT